MTALWIVHREETLRRAWAEALGEPLAAGHPADLRTFAEAAAPAVVVLGLEGDGEAELEFAHRHAGALGDAAWLVVAAPESLAEARRLFDALPADFAPSGAAGPALRRRVEALVARRAAPPLSERGRRDRLRERFARWFGDLDLPEVLAATDPRRVEVPLWVRGEPGTGRGLLARYVHLVGSGPPPGPFVALPCAGVDAVEALAERAVVETGRLPGGHHVTLCLEDVEQLAAPLQRAVAGWIAHGPPAGLARAPRHRWMALTDERADGELDEALVDALAGFACRLPPLAERAAALADFVAATTRAWCRDHGDRERALAPDAVAALVARSWPHNLRELEAVLHRTLAASGAVEIPAGELRLDPALAAAPTRPATSAPAGALRPPVEEAGARPPAAAEEAGPLRRVAAAVAREARAPLGGIRTLARMMPRRFSDPDYREQLLARIETDAARIQTVLDALARLAELPAPSPSRVDVSSLLSGLLEMRRSEIDERRLVALEELDRERPFARADREQLRLAFETLVAGALDWLADGGELTLATHHRRAPGGGGALRVVLRLRQPAGAAGPGPDGDLSTSVVELVVGAQGGRVRQGGEAGERWLEIELPTGERGDD